MPAAHRTRTYLTLCANVSDRSELEARTVRTTVVDLVLGGRFKEPAYPLPASKAVRLGVKHLGVVAPIASV